MNELEQFEQKLNELEQQPNLSVEQLQFYAAANNILSLLKNEESDDLPLLFKDLAKQCLNCLKQPTTFEELQLFKGHVGRIAIIAMRLRASSSHKVLTASSLLFSTLALVSNGLSQELADVMNGIVESTPKSALFTILREIGVPESLLPGMWLMTKAGAQQSGIANEPQVDLNLVPSYQESLAKLSAETKHQPSPTP